MKTTASMRKRINSLLEELGEGWIDVLPVLKHRDSNTCCYRVEVSHVIAEASFPR